MEYNKSNLTQELATNFIEYAAAVNSDRSIPDAASGLKPVARRIIYGAYATGRSSSKPHVKAAKVVGDVMGAYHPHGNSSIYGALVRLAQPWIMRYPLVDFHGNMGNVGGDGPAAERYTEVRLNKLSEEGMLSGIKKNNVNFIPTYDDSDEEPDTLPAIFPNLLCNPNSGIGVAMACNWACHNLGEVAEAIYQYMDGKEPELIGPDFPTGGIIINKNDMPNIMRTGHGSVKIRGKYKIEKQNIVFYEIPYGVATEDLLKQIGELSDNKTIEGIDSLRDESNKNGMRIVIECEKGINPESLVSILFAKTDLQSSFSYNQVALVNKKPTELNLKDCIRIYVEHNLSCIKKEAEFDLSKARERLNIVNGLLRALEDIDNIIALIKASESSSAAKERLIAAYDFNLAQATAIVEMKLGKLAGLEKIELNQEQKELELDIEKLNTLANTKAEQEKELRIRLGNIVKKFGDKRRTEIIQLDIPKEEKEIETVMPENCVVVLSTTGDIKRVPTSNFKVQARNGKGAKTEDDSLLDIISTNTQDTLMLFSSLGKMYRILVNDIVEGNNTSKGTNVNNYIKLAANEKIVAMTSLYRQSSAKYVIFITKNGMFKKTELEEYKGSKRSTLGIGAIKIKEGDELIYVTFAEEEEFILLTKKGQSIRFESKSIAPIGKLTMGVKTIKLAEGDEVVIALPIKHKTDKLAIVDSKGCGKKVNLEEFPTQGKTGLGLKVKINENSELIGAALVTDTDYILILSGTNGICISAKEIPTCSRTSIGNILIKNGMAKKAIKIKKEG